MNRNLPRYVQIENEKNLVRDTFSMGVINTNQMALLDAKRRKQEALNKIAEDRRKDLELNTLRKDVAELKSMVIQLLEKNNANS